MNSLAKLIQPDLHTFASSILFNASLYACMCILVLSDCLEIGFSHSEMATQSPLHLAKTLYCGISHSETRLCPGISSSKRPCFAALLMGLPPLGSECEPNSVVAIFSSHRFTPRLGFTPLGGKILQEPLWD